MYVCAAGQELLQAPPQMTVLSSQAMPYPAAFQPQPGSVPGQLLPSNDYADLGEKSLCAECCAVPSRLWHASLD